MSCYVPGCKILTISFAGAKVHQSQECTRIIEPGGVSYTLESVGGIEGATHNMKPLLEHAQNLYKQCVHLERVMNKEESNSNEGQYFPFIVCRKPPASRTVPKGSDVHNESQNSRPPDSLENLTVTSPSTLAPVSTSLMSFDGTVASTYQQVRVNRRSASCGDESGKNSRSQCEEGRRTQQSQSTAKGAPRQGANVSPSSQVIKSVFVHGVGWASELSTGEIWVQYNDGSQMVIQSSVTRIKYTDSTGAITRYTHTDRLPEPIKDKLSRLPVLIENLAASPKIS